MLKEEYKIYQEKMKKSIESVITDFDAVRAGRANAAVLNRISVDYYGTPTPIQQIASVGSPDPRTLVITPYDKSTLKAMEKAIQMSEPKLDWICILSSGPIKILWPSIWEAKVTPSSLIFRRDARENT